jgi:hypothetical protein
MSGEQPLFFFLFSFFWVIFRAIEQNNTYFIQCGDDIWSSYLYEVATKASLVLLLGYGC